MLPRSIRKATLLLFVLALVFSNSGFIFAASSDIENHWAKTHASYLAEKSIIKGYPDGTFKPENNITKAEFYTIINRLMGYTEKAEINFADVNNEWFHDEVAKGVKAGYIFEKEGEKILPNTYITRQEVAKIVGIAFGLEQDPTSSVDLKDYYAIEDEAKGYVGVLKDKGYITGYPDGTYKPYGNITRAEAAAMIAKASGIIINAANEYTEVAEGNVLVNVADVTLKDMTIKGDLYLAEGIGDGDVTLDNVTVNGETYVRGGGENSIIIKNSSLQKVVVNKTASKVRVVLEGNVDIPQLVLSKNAKIVAKEGAVIDSIKVEGKAEIEVQKGATVKELAVNAKDASIVAEGKIQSVVATEAVSINDKVYKEGSDISISNGKVDVKRDEPATTDGGGSSSGGSSSDGGDSSGGEPTGPVIVPVSSISVDPDVMTLYVGGATGIIKATVNPSEATNQAITWTSSNTAVATVVNGVVTPVSEGTATITATVGDETATTTVTVEQRQVYDFTYVVNESLVGYLNILKASVEFRGDEITLSMYLREIPDSILVNNSETPDDDLEYAWGVLIGTESLQGYEVSATRFKFAGEDPVNLPIEEAVQVDVWELDNHPSSDINHGTSLSEAQLIVDQDLNLIEITGKIPNISKETVDYIEVFTESSNYGGEGLRNVPVSAIIVTGADNATTITTDSGTLQMSATISPASVPNKNVTWSIINGTGQATINPNGLVTAIANGTVIVKATAQDGSGVFGTKEITISNQVPLKMAYGNRDNDTQITITLSKEVKADTITKDNDGGFTVEDAVTGKKYAVTKVTPGANNSGVVLIVENFSASEANGIIVKYTQGGNGTIEDDEGIRLETDEEGLTWNEWKAPTIIAGDVIRTDIGAKIAFTTDEAGEFYVAIVDQGESDIFYPSIGNPCEVGERTLIIPNTSRDVDVYIVVKDAVGNESEAIKITIPAQTAALKEITSVASIDDINVPYGTELSAVELPETVEVTLDDQTSTTLAVNWDSGASTYDGNTAGTYAVKGTLTLVDGIANADGKTVTVNVVVAASVETSIQSVVATNGTVTITLVAKPTVAPIASDFTATVEIDGGTAETLDLTNFTYDGIITIAYNFTPITQTSLEQRIVVTITLAKFDIVAPTFTVASL